MYKIVVCSTFNVRFAVTKASSQCTSHNDFKTVQNKSNITFYYQSGKYVLRQLHSQFKDIQSYQYKTKISQRSV